MMLMLQVGSRHSLLDRSSRKTPLPSCTPPDQVKLLFGLNLIKFYFVKTLARLHPPDQVEL